MESVTSGEPGHPHGLDGGRVVIRLHGHPFTYTVRAATGGRAGPELTELTITADEGHVVDYAAVRAVPTRRLAYSAAQWFARWGGQVAFVGDTADQWARPEDTDPRVYRAAQIAERAIGLGLPVRPTVAAELNVSARTVDRLLARARAEGWLDQPLPRRPQPPQRDTTTTTEGTR